MKYVLYVLKQEHKKDSLNNFKKDGMAKVPYRNIVIEDRFNIRVLEY